MKNGKLTDGQEIGFNRTLWDQGYGPLSDETLEALGLTEIDLPEGPHDPMGVYRDQEGQKWVILWDELEKKAEIYKEED